MRKMNVLLLLILAIIALVACGQESVGNNPTVRGILKGNPEADLIKLDKLVYVPFDSENNGDYSKGELIGETNKSWWYGNLYASKLPKSTKVYTTDDDDYKKGDAPFVIIIELNHELIVYHSLIEG